MIIYFVDIIERTLRGICGKPVVSATSGQGDGDEAGESAHSTSGVNLGERTFRGLEGHSWEVYCRVVLQEAAIRYIASHGSIYGDGAEAGELDVAALNKYLRYVVKPPVESGFDIATNLPFVLGHFVAIEDKVITPALLAEQFLVEFSKADNERLFDCSVGGPVNGMGFINAVNSGRLFERIACDEACERISDLEKKFAPGIHAAGKSASVNVERVFDNLIRRGVNTDEISKLLTARAMTFEQLRSFANADKTLDCQPLDGRMLDDFTMLFFLSYFPECQVDAYLGSYGGKQNFPWLCRQALKDIDKCLGVYRKIFGSRRLYSELAQPPVADNTGVAERQPRFVKALESIAKHLLELRGDVLEASRLYQPGKLLVIQKELIDSFYCIYNHPDVRSGRIAELDEEGALVFYSLLSSVRSAIRCLYQTFGTQIGKNRGCGGKNTEL